MDGIVGVGFTDGKKKKTVKENLLTDIADSDGSKISRISVEKGLEPIKIWGGGHSLFYKRNGKAVCTYGWICGDRSSARFFRSLAAQDITLEWRLSA